ncbi:hypothetical protein T05_8228 [Trichinella murrelli]|uniref:Uncharacterized protein n=1 Tax=Trichinella murrelli TaxID=144512 RepID=A0A0V0TGZ2_9BILA|nr:hypothetical protein T05_8228 [Trichinella murrelli]
MKFEAKCISAETQYLHGKVDFINGIRNIFESLVDEWSDDNPPLFGYVFFDYIQRRVGREDLE